MLTPPIYQRNRLVSTGNLSYLDFVRVVERAWTNSHPDIPLFAQGGKQVANYPQMFYRLAYRNPVQNEHKPRYREAISTRPQDPAIINRGQRFNNFITFVVMTEENPHLAEAIIEEFEDFMLAFTPAFKELGLSDIFYARREPDVMDLREGGTNRIEKAVTYNAITEKIIQVDLNKLTNFMVDVRTFLANNPYWYELATPNFNISYIDQFQGSTPA